MFFAVPLIGYSVLVMVATIVFFLSCYTSFSAGLIPMGLLQGVILISLVYQYRIESVESLLKNKTQNVESTYEVEDFLNGFSVLSGALAAFGLSVEFGLGAVVASCIVGIMATLLVPDYDVPVYCGAFVGMASPAVVSGYTFVGLAGFLAGLLFVASRDTFAGFGGKLGTIAFSGGIVTALLTGTELSSSSVPGWNIGQYLVLYSVIGAVATFFLNESLGHSAVTSSAVVGLLGGLLLPIVYPVFGETLAVMVVCASYAGMSSLSRIPNGAYMAVAGAFCALVFMFTSPYFGGLGGKLGTIAFGSVTAIRGMQKLSYRFTEPLAKWNENETTGAINEIGD